MGGEKMTEEKKELYVKRKTENGEEEFIFRPTGELFQHIKTSENLQEKIQYYKSGRIEKKETQEYDFNGKRTIAFSEEFFDTDFPNLKSWTDYIIGLSIDYPADFKDKPEERFFLDEEMLADDIDRAKRQQYIMEKELFEKFPQLQKRKYIGDSDEAVIWRSQYREAFISHFCEQPRFALLNKHFDDVFPKTQLDKEVEKIEKEIRSKEIKETFKGLKHIIKRSTQEVLTKEGLSPEKFSQIVDDFSNPKDLDGNIIDDNPNLTNEEKKRAIINLARQNLAQRENATSQDKKVLEKQQASLTPRKESSNNYSISQKDASSVNITINAMKNSGR